MNAYRREAYRRIAELIATEIRDVECGRPGDHTQQRISDEVIVEMQKISIIMEEAGKIEDVPVPLDQPEYTSVRARKPCPSCGSTEVVFDDERGGNVCGRCGGTHVGYSDAV